MKIVVQIKAAKKCNVSELKNFILQGSDPPQVTKRSVLSVENFAFSFV